MSAECDYSKGFGVQDSGANHVQNRPDLEFWTLYSEP